MNFALRPPDFFRLYGPGGTAPSPPPIPTTGSYSQFGLPFAEPPVFIQPLHAGGSLQLYDERCLLRRPPDAGPEWPTPKSELRRLATELCATAAHVTALLRGPDGHPARGGDEILGDAPLPSSASAAVERAELVCANAQHLLSRLREPEAWALAVQAAENLLRDTVAATERLARAVEQREEDRRAAGSVATTAGDDAMTPQGQPGGLPRADNKPCHGLAVA